MGRKSGCFRPFKLEMAAYTREKERHPLLLGSTFLGIAVA